MKKPGKNDRTNASRWWLLPAILLLVGCSPPAEEPLPPGTNIVTVIGAIHGQHRRSESYSLDVLKEAIRKFDPDIVMVELPPDRFKTASDNFRQFGEVRESRADDFPEQTDVIFPLREELGFEIVAVASWTPEIAANRRAVEKKIENDPARAADWAAYQDAIRQYGNVVSGRSDDPQFVHSEAYDAAVKERQETYERLFGDDLGASGWAAINKAHFSNIKAELENLKGREKRILILFGAWHKYKILKGLEATSGIQVKTAEPLF